MKERVFALLVGLLLLVSTKPNDLHAQCYSFTQTTGSRMTGNFTDLGFSHRTGTPWGSSFDSRVVSLGFTFRFNEIPYTQVTVYHNGVVAMGSTSLVSPTYNQLQGASAPIIAPFWDDMRVTDGMRSQGSPCSPSSIRYVLNGSSPNRVMVIDWDQIGLGQGGYGFRAPLTFQVRLYEGSNKIEFYYNTLDGNSDGCSQWGSGRLSSSASIGLASAGAFMSISPNNGTASSSTTVANDYVDVYNTPINVGTMYVFSPGGVTGNVAEGGTTNMTAGDTLFVGKRVILSSSQSYKPFTLVSFCASTFSYSITGASAGEYSISPTSGPLPQAGNTPTITFTPTGIGKRYATLTMTAGSSVSRNYVLAGEGVPRTIWIGNLPQGGTTTMRSGDTLMRNIAVHNGLSGNYTPFTIQVPVGGNIPAPMTFTLIDPTGQFRIDRTSQVVLPGSSSTPVITFAPTGVGWQTATLTANAEGEVRSFILRAFASGAGAVVTIAGEQVMSGLPVFRNVFSCVGAEVQTVQVTVESIGDEPFLIQTDNAYETDNVIKQGSPPFELLRDPFGNFVPVNDYFISSGPGVKTPIPLPVSIAPGTTQTIYLNFLPNRAGKRQARAFFGTNGLNFFGIDVNKNSVQGMLNFELVGTGLGASMTDVSGKKLPEAVIFPATDVRSTVTLTGSIKNNGDCDMLIPSADFRLVSGDINEFKIVSPLNVPQDGAGNFVITPGQTASFDVSFTPSRSGSRRASIRVRSNDSSLVILGLSEIGVDYIDVFGVGKVGLEARSVTLPPAVIDGPGSRGQAVIENTASELVTITNIVPQGGNGEIGEDPTNRWPVLPVKLGPGEKINLGLTFTPAPGSSPGVRTATLEITLSNGNVLIVDVKGIAGTRKLSVVPTGLFQNLQLNVGDVRRQVLAVTNAGTFPVTLQELKLIEANAGDYKVGPLVRAVMEPGQIEFYEVTYSPQAIGASSGTLEVISNATDAPHIVNLGGEGTTIAQSGGNASGSNIAVTGQGEAAIRPGSSISGWGAAMQNGTLLWQSTPNPTEGAGEIRYYLPEGGNVELTLFTSRGEKVQELVSGAVGSGEHRVALDLRSLASGRYYYTLRTSGGALTLALDLVK